MTCGTWWCSPDFELPPTGSIHLEHGLACVVNLTASRPATNAMSMGPYGNFKIQVRRCWFAHLNPIEIFLKNISPCNWLHNLKLQYRNIDIALKQAKCGENFLILAGSYLLTGAGEFPIFRSPLVFKIAPLGSYGQAKMRSSSHIPSKVNGHHLKFQNISQAQQG